MELQCLQRTRSRVQVPPGFIAVMKLVAQWIERVCFIDTCRLDPIERNWHGECLQDYIGEAKAPVQIRPPLLSSDCKWSDVLQPPCPQPLN